MEEKKLGKPKISLQFQLSESGLTELIKAEAAVEETYTVEEEVEVDDEGSEEDSDEKNVDDAIDSATQDEKAEDRKLEESGEEANSTKVTATDANSTAADEPAKENPKKKTILQEKVSHVACNCLLDVYVIDWILRACAPC